MAGYILGIKNGYLMGFDHQDCPGRYPDGGGFGGAHLRYPERSGLVPLLLSSPDEDAKSVHVDTRMRGG
jgi:hypothetical protein